jgi:general secretion pathway protein D
MRHVLKRWRATQATALSVALKAAVLSAIVLTVASGAIAGDGIMLKVTDVTLKDVVTLLMQQSGANMVIADSSMLEKKITANLSDVSLEKALNHIVKSAGIAFKKMDDGTYIIGGGFAEEPVMNSPSVVESLPPVEIEQLAPPSKEKQYVSIKLIHSKPSELLRLIGWDGANPMPNTDAVYPDRNKTNQPPTNPGGVYLNTSDGKVYDTGKGVRFENNQPVVPTIDPSSLNRGAGRTADPYTGAGQFVDQSHTRPVGYPPGTSTRPQGTGTGTTGTGGTTGGTSTQSGNFLWPEGVDDARPFDLDNSIIVKGDEDGIEKFKKIIRMLDVPPKQVQIKAEFVEVSTTDIKNFGIDWSLQRLNESFATAFAPSGNVIVGFATGNLTAQLKAQLTSDVGRIINSPIISTINNQNAYISINTTIPYWVSVATVVGDNNIINQSTPQFITIDTHLDVLPRVNGDGTITMILRPGVADTGAQVTGPDGTSIPEQRTQELFTQRRVANGETIVIGGFIRKEDSNSIQKIPVLADLPIVGSLFRTTAKKQVERELLIFVTPTIILETGGGTVGESPIL